MHRVYGARAAQSTIKEGGGTITIEEAGVEARRTYLGCSSVLTLTQMNDWYLHGTIMSCPLSYLQGLSPCCCINGKA